MNPKKKKNRPPPAPQAPPPVVPAPPPPPDPPAADPKPLPPPKPARAGWVTAAVLLTGYLVVLAVVLPATYANSGYVGLWLTFFGVNTAYFLVGYRLAEPGDTVGVIVLRSTVLASASGLLVGLLVGPVLARPAGWLLGVQVGLGVSGGGLLFCACRTFGVEPTADSSRRPALALTTFLCFAALGLKWQFGTLPDHRFRFYEMYMAAQITAVVLLVPSLWLGNQVRRGLAELGRVMPLVRVFARGLVGFAAVYLLVSLLFATWYWCLYEADPRSFTGDAIPPHGGWDRFVTFLYFSAVSLVILGYTDIMPASPWSRAVLTAQFVLGLAWTTVFFAFMMTHFQRTLPPPGGQAPPAGPPGGTAA